mgnify:CR=1 FL=1
MRKRILTVISMTFLIIIALGAGFCFAIYHGYLHVNGWAADRYPVRGVDVSHYQGDIDWQILSRQNIKFAYIKATEGSSHVDRQFVLNCEKALETDLKVGAYHFFSFDSPGTAQAEHFLETVKPYKNLMAPVVDVEFYGDKKENPPDSKQVEAELKDYLEKVEQTCGQKPVIYATQEAWELYIQGRFDSYPLWIRDIWNEPKLKTANGQEEEYQWIFWQYTNRGRLKGFSGEEDFVDLNVFYGTEEQWLLFTD